MDTPRHGFFKVSSIKDPSDIIDNRIIIIHFIKETYITTLYNVRYQSFILTA